MLLVLIAPVDCEPLVALFPDHVPEAVQLVAFVLLHVSVELLPLDTVPGLAVSETVGAAAVVLLTLTATALEVRELPAASRAVAVSV